VSEANGSDAAAVSGERPGPELARSAGLRYVNGFEAGIRRRRCGRGFSYRSQSGQTIRSRRQRERIDSLAIPPAWQDVWICPRPDGHIQAVGRDGDGRLQYIYHERWHAISAATKYDRMHLMAQLLPRIRRRVRRDLKVDELTRERVVAAVVRLLDKAHLRVGNESYARLHGSRGVTTLTTDHVEVEQFRISLSFPGKSGKEHEVEFQDEMTAEVVRQCEEIDGHFLFCYLDGDGSLQSVASTDVNGYLGAATDQAITAKDFRTWWGSVIALAELTKTDGTDLTPPQRRRVLSAAIARTAQALGNTPAVCRGSYVHPGIPALFEAGSLAQLIEQAEATAPPRADELTADERRLVALLPELRPHCAVSVP
jgi:DNA topoisomerase I